MRFNYIWFKIGAVGGGDDDGGEDNKEKAEEEERERLEAIREAEERRKEKHRKMEEEREKMRQDIRDKVTLMQLFINHSQYTRFQTKNHSLRLFNFISWNTCTHIPQMCFNL